MAELAGAVKRKQDALRGCSAAPSGEAAATKLASAADQVCPSVAELQQMRSGLRKCSQPATLSPAPSPAPVHAALARQTSSPEWQHSPTMALVLPAAAGATCPDVPPEPTRIPTAKLPARTGADTAPSLSQSEKAQGTQPVAAETAVAHRAVDANGHAHDAQITAPARIEQHVHNTHSVPDQAHHPALAPQSSPASSPLAPTMVLDAPHAAGADASTSHMLDAAAQQHSMQAGSAPGSAPPSRVSPAAFNMLVDGSDDFSPLPTPPEIFDSADTEMVAPTQILPHARDVGAGISAHPTQAVQATEAAVAPSVTEDTVPANAAAQQRSGSAVRLPQPGQVSSHSAAAALPLSPVVQSSAVQSPSFADGVGNLHATPHSTSAPAVIGSVSRSRAMLAPRCSTGLPDARATSAPRSSTGMSGKHVMSEPRRAPSLTPGATRHENAALRAENGQLRHVVQLLQELLPELNHPDLQTRPTHVINNLRMQLHGTDAPAQSAAAAQPRKLHIKRTGNARSISLAGGTPTSMVATAAYTPITGVDPLATGTPAAAVAGHTPIMPQDQFTPSSVVLDKVRPVWLIQSSDMSIAAETQTCRESCTLTLDISEGYLH